jgi:hypothetical protein
MTVLDAYWPIRQADAGVLFPNMASLPVKMADLVA